MMENTTRVVLFIGLCIPLRLGLAYLPHILPYSQLRYLGILTATMAFGALYLALTHTRLHAIEGGGYTWWAPYRLIHGMLLLTATLYLIRKERTASVPLLMDALLGLVLFFTVRVNANF